MKAHRWSSLVLCCCLLHHVWSLILSRLLSCGCVLLLLLFFSISCVRERHVQVGQNDLGSSLLITNAFLDKMLYRGRNTYSQVWQYCSTVKLLSRLLVAFLCFIHCQWEGGSGIHASGRFIVRKSTSLLMSLLMAERVTWQWEWVVAALS